MYLLNRAFRLFFLGAVGFAVISMIVWWWQWHTPPSAYSSFSGLSPLNWHAHEMIFGYALATVTGFLLTAAMNWTRMETASGWPLAGLFACWLLARLGFILNWPLAWVALFDLAFGLGLLIVFSWPIWQRRLKAQSGLATLFFALWLSHIAFYYAAVYQQAWLSNTLVLALFLVLTINLVMIRRLVPFFTEKTLGLTEVKNHTRLDQVALVGFLVLGLAWILLPNTIWLTLIAWPLAIVFAIRQAWWYDKGIWRQVLLWPLHLSYGFITLGIALIGLVGLQLVMPTTAIHALAAGGIGLLCSAMMARISLGHTKRNIYHTPKGLVWVFVLLALAALFRVIMPVIWPSLYSVWIQLAQWGWIAGFAGLFILYWPILSKPDPVEPKSSLTL
ncbi:NnrS family protein [Thiomicrospira microaerophila]|uniref:NnrS family protein n=1 Tax=Thiomicrospira microaerophila TaxID=406020 RepID=UPI00200D3950|nr:NnrS family protein [Thiomicrospira microaerophila]UQB42232.1 NnrS family protein [Thiomicrospira microaerophila]